MKGKFADLRQELGIEVTPMLYRFALRIFELDAELETFGAEGMSLGRLEKDAILLLRSERRMFEKSLLQRQ